MNRFRRAARVAPWMVLAVPAVLAAGTLYAILQNYSPAPFMDYWENLYWWRRLLEDGRLPAGYFFSQHNEHRIPLPRLIYFADLKWFRGTSALNLIVTALLQASAAILLISAAGLRSLRWPGLLGLALALSLIVCLSQWENFLFGFQVQFAGVYAAGAWAIYLFSLAERQDGRVAWPTMAGALIVLIAATFSMANGVFAGVAMVLATVVSRRGWKPAAVAAVATAVLLAVYLHGYVPVPHPEPSPDGLVVQYVRYLLAYLGNVWGLGQMPLALVAGGGAVLLTVAMVAVTWFGRIRDPARVAMLGIVLFVGLSAGVTSLSRLGYGPEQALSSRYQTPIAYLWAAHALFWGLTLQRWRKPLWSAIAAVPLGVALICIPVAQRQGAITLYGFREHILLGSSALVGGIEDDKALLRLYPEAGRVRDFRPFLRSRGLTIFADDPGYAVGQTLPAARVVPEACAGALDVIDKDPGGGAAWRVLGWGWDRQQGRPFERVVLANQTGAIVGVAIGGLGRDDVPKVLREISSSRTGWVGYVTAPAPGEELVAYGVRVGGTLCEFARKAAP